MKKITHKLYFKDEEEGELSFFEGEKELLSFSVYPMDENTAEVSAQDVGLMRELQENQNIQEEIISKMTECVIELFEVLEQDGWDVVSIVTEKSSKFEQILGSTNVVQKEYSEFMMCSPKTEAETTSSCGFIDENLSYRESDEGIECTNEEQSFFAKVMPYRDGWYVYEVEVAYDKRRTGIASACMRGLKRRFLQLYLQVGSYNEAAWNLYNKLEFQVIEELCYYGRK